MRTRFRPIALVVAAVFVGSGLLAQGKWTIPPAANEEKSPLTVTPELLKKGKSTFTKRCQHCHGVGGQGDGPDAEKDLAAEMDLTSLDEPEGVTFYKVWNGRKQPKMPSFKTEMTREEVWTVVAYVRSLGKGV